MPPSKASSMVRRHFEVGETAVTILAEEDYIDLAKDSIFRSREEIQRYIASDPLFKDTLEPYRAGKGAPDIIRRMCGAASKASVGPMAAVAGAIAQQAVWAMVSAGATHAVVDNGGDIAMFLSEDVDVGIYAGASSIRDLGLRFLGEKRHYSVCTSSGTVGPSISFGIADAAIVLAEDAALADACATRLGNDIQVDEEEGMLYAIDLVLRVPGVDGALVVVGDRMAMMGKVPELVKVRFDETSITHIEL